LEIKKILEINASVDVVYKALTDINELVHWWPDQGSFEPKVGGRIQFKFVSGGNKMVRKGQELNGEILEIIPNKKIIYTFEPRDSHNPKIDYGHPTKVSWILDEIDENRTRVTLIHDGFSDAGIQNIKGSKLRWDFFLLRLVTYCSKVELLQT
jgi:uncharacterized protein YndB with AHSA1/START domain